MAETELIKGSLLYSRVMNTNIDLKVELFSTALGSLKHILGNALGEVLALYISTTAVSEVRRKNFLVNIF